VITFTPQLLYTQRKIHQHPLDRRAGRPESAWTLWRSEKTCIISGSPVHSPLLHRLLLPDNTQLLITSSVHVHFQDFNLLGHTFLSRPSHSGRECLNTEISKHFRFLHMRSYFCTKFCTRISVNALLVNVRICCSISKFLLFS
jgi:hypothetical protein